MIFILVLILVATLVYFRLVKPLDYWQKRGVKQQNRLKAFLFNWFGLFRKESVTTYVQRMYDQFPNAKGWMYPTQVINERTCTESFTIQPESPGEKPFRIEKGVYVIFPSFAIQRDPTNFPNPDRFDPERFNNENKGKIVPQTYQPFGHGPRKCIGARLALLETKVLFFYLLSNFEIVPVEKTKIPLVMSKNILAMTSEGGFWLGLKRLVK